jgi:leukotriene-A4 hydrolase
VASIHAGYEGATARTAEFLSSQGRRKFLKPIYTALAATPAGKERALAIYRKARPTYHAIAVQSIDQVLDWKG